jgi:hypothetical protein
MFFSLFFFRLRQPSRTHPAHVSLLAEAAQGASRSRRGQDATSGLAMGELPNLLPSISFFFL